MDVLKKLLEQEATPSWALGVVIAMTKDVAKEFKGLDIVTKIETSNSAHVFIKKCEYFIAISTSTSIASSAFCDIVIVDRIEDKAIKSEEIGHKDESVKIPQPEALKNHLAMLFTKLPAFTPAVTPTTGTTDKEE